MPMNTIPGTNRHQAVSEAIAMMPTAIHMSDTTSRKAGLEGRRPICIGVSASIRRRREAWAADSPRGVALGVTRPVVRGLRRRLAMIEKVTGEQTSGPR